MKTPLILLAVCSFLFFSCKKSTVALNPGFIGTWEIERYTGYPFPAPYAAGNGNLLKLYENRKVERFESGVLVESGTFTFKKKKDCYEREEKTLIIFTYPNNKQEYYISLNDDQLWLSGSNCLQDVGTAIYRRL